MEQPERGVPGAEPAAAGHSDTVPAASACPDTDTREGVGADGDTTSHQLSTGLEGTGAPQPQEESPGTLRCPPPDPQRVRSVPELIRPLRTIEGLGWNRMDRPHQSEADYGFLVSQNTKLLSALEDLRHRCSSLAEENNLLRRSCFPQTEEKVKHLKRKNAELAVIAKRLEERARKLQEANLKVVTAPVPLKGPSLELCKKAFARQRAKDLTEQASALLAKDKQIEALQQECRELQAKLSAGKDDPRCLNVIEFDRLLRESQREVLRLQRQIALKNFKESLRSSKSSSGGSLPSAAARLGPLGLTLNTCTKGSPLPKEARLGDPALGGEGRREVEPGVQSLGPASEGHENFPPKNAVTDPASRHQIKQLEFELKKKRKKCENLEHEVRKKHKRCKELEIQLQEVQNENARLAEENLQLNEKAGWAGQVESENADLKLQVVLVTKERDSVIQTNQGLQTKLENLEQVLKHMRNVAERRQLLEVEHKEALLVLQEKQEEVRRLQQAQAEAKREHEGAVQLLEARVKDLEDQCRSQTEQFSLLSQELKQFRLQTGKIDLLTSTLVTSELPLALCSSTPQPRWEKESTVPGLLTHQSAKKVHNEAANELESSQRAPDATVGSPVAAAGAQKQAKRAESQSSSSKSESMHNSPKSCPTPEVDTASEMEELDVDSISLMPEPGSQGHAKLQVFLARYSYNPFDGPNENPEAELPLTAGEYIYVYGDMDEDGFFEGTPDAPLDVQVEAGPSPGILVISWLPVTIDAEGSSNGVRVTGYAVYADGQKAIEVTSPTAGSVLVDLSQLQMFQVCREVSVRTMSLYGESVDSVPAQISSVLLRTSHRSSPSRSALSTTFTSRPPHGEPRGSLPARSPPTHQAAALLLRQKAPTDNADAKLTDPSSSHNGSAPSLPEKASSPPHLSSPGASLVQVSGASPQGSDAARDKKCLSVPPQQVGGTALPTEGTEPIPSRNAELQGLGKGTEVQVEQSVTKAPELESPSNSSLKIRLETCHACSVEESPEGPGAEGEKEAKEQHWNPEPLPSPSQAEGTGDTSRDTNTGGSSCQDFLRLSPGKEVMKEMSRVKREQEEKMSEMGRRQLTLFAEHNRSSDLSDILEEEEEDELSSEALEEKKWDQREPCYQENGEKAPGHKDPRGQEPPRAATWQGPSRRRNKSLRRSQTQKPLLFSPGPPRSTASETSIKDDDIRIFVALFDYDPVSMSPNPDAAEEELPFKEGQILKVCGDKDADGFYRGESAGREGYIPCNMVSEVQVENNEIKKQLLKQGFLPADTPMESIGNGTFSPPPRRQSVPPPKPRRSKKGLDKQEKYKSHPDQQHQDFEAELLTPRSMVAVFDYNPKESSPNADVEAELTFRAGDIITVFGSMDDDGFYYGELNQQRGLVPSNFLEAVAPDGGPVEELHSKDKEAFPLSSESQRMRKRRVQ
ncbi:peripheral-type benzodiazepine receptor-associated protein 1 isoform X13 [Columba livia]|uniref:peripheral-type benzodiazepine receptor-associated protein 1 isoform X13 n=1 Tax=Columba livia TaxID=8932 RepID=UPI0031BAB9F0